MVALRTLVVVIGLLGRHVVAQNLEPSDVKPPSAVTPVTAVESTVDSTVAAPLSEAPVASTARGGLDGPSGLGGSLSPQATDIPAAETPSGDLRASASPTTSDSATGATSDSVSAGRPAGTSTPTESSPNFITTSYTLAPGSPMFPEGWKIAGLRSPNLKRQNDATAETEQGGTAPIILPSGTISNGGATPGGIGNNTDTSTGDGKAPAIAKPQPLMFTGSKITVKGTLPANSTGVVWTLNNNPAPSNDTTVEPGVIFQRSDLPEAKVHTLLFESQQPLDISEIKIEMRAQVSGGLNQETACQTIPFVEGNKLKTDTHFKISGASVKGEVVETTESLQITPAEGTVLVKILGAVNSSYGSYTAYLDADSKNTIKGFANAQNSGEKEALYWLSTLPGDGSNKNIRLDANGTIGLRSVQFCYSSKDLKDKASSSSGAGKSKSNVGPIVGGVIGGVAALAIMGTLLYCCKKKRTREQQTYRSVTAFHGGGSAEAGDTMKQVNHGDTNKSLPAVSTREKAPVSPGSTAPLLGVSHLATRGEAQRLSTRPDHKAGGGDGDVDGDALPVYNHGWTSTATGDVKGQPKVRGFVARRASQTSLATTISTVDDDDDDDDNNNLHPGSAVASGAQRPSRPASSASRK